MAVQLDNLDDVLKQLAKLEIVAETEVIRDARKRMRATIRSYQGQFKKLTPPKKDTGQLVKSVKVKSRSRRGVSTVRLVWGVPYAGPLNFKKGQSAEGFVTEEFQRLKNELDRKGFRDVQEAFKFVLEKYGVQVELT